MNINRIISVPMLFVRQTLFKFLLILAVMTVAEGLLFMISLDNVIENSQNTFSVPTEFSSYYEEQLFADAEPYTGDIPLDRVIDDGGIKWVLLGGFLLTAALLASNLCEFSSKCGYTVDRLCIGRRTVFTVHSLVNAAYFFVLLVWQILLAVVMCFVAASRFDGIGEQTILLAFYRSDLLHSLLPLDEWVRLARNILLILTLGAETAYFSYKNRRSKLSKGSIFLAALTVIFFVSPTGGFTADFVLMVVSLFTLGVTLMMVFANGEEEEENEAA